ncbi:MAG: sigma-54 dependent transcriptional regulator [Candidatus Aminicenantes bacterium]|nr:sigma-54 dependent transcriptional regulator [Candidatus Aminicenantes bacterium]
MEKILIIDDEKGILDLLSMVFKKEGYEVGTAINAERALNLIETGDFDLVLSDIKLPNMGGMDVLKAVNSSKPDVSVVLMTAYGTISQAVEAMKIGAIDYIVKPFDMDELKIIVRQGLEKRRLQSENVRLKKELRQKYEFHNMVGKSQKIQAVFDLIEKIAATDSTVLITGESGTGKEMAARAIHYLSDRRDQPFISLNCGALPENLLESELFGHVKGAFTGAVVLKKGMFEVAEKGTLFLDEIGEMSPVIQVKFLRALQERTIRQLGGTREIPIDVRIISATNMNLKDKIAEKEFREDLYYRLHVIALDIPPLRERHGDIPLHVDYFLKKYCQKMNRRMKRIIPDVMNIFELYPWPGNIRELENTMERIVAIEDRETITRDSLPLELLEPSSEIMPPVSIRNGFNLNAALDDLSRKYLSEALRQTGGNLKESARILGLNYRSIRYLTEKYDLKD